MADLVLVMFPVAIAILMLFYGNYVINRVEDALLTLEVVVRVLRRREGDPELARLEKIITSTLDNRR